MRCLITGGCGFVGRHFAKRLADDGHNIVVVDDFSTGRHPKDWAFKPNNGPYSVSVRRMDCRDFFRGQEQAQDFDLIIHCAAVVGGRLKIEGDPLAVATDLAIDSDFFRWCVVPPAAGASLPRKVVYFSSSAVYPTDMQRRGDHEPLKESYIDFTHDYVSMPDATYGWSKLTGELLAQYAAKTYGLDVVTYRPFSGYGEDQDEAYPFPAIIRRVVNREDPIVIWGSGEQLRDFIHIDDVVEAVMQTKDKLAPGEVLNLGSGEGVSFTTLAANAASLVPFVPKIVTDPTKPEGVFARVADVTKMRQFYTPKVSLVEGIRRSLDYVRRTM